VKITVAPELTDVRVALTVTVVFDVTAVTVVVVEPTVTVEPTETPAVEATFRVWPETDDAVVLNTSPTVMYVGDSVG